ncbi:GGDEF domain-containing protein [Thalassoglobus sp.]|uniref:GGDEF domain-containing protein n=1 Tax=Thalassoglobus sp. TaxID=2795869 RepID=UPI003AA83579
MRETTSRMIFVAVSAWLSICLLLAGWMPELDSTFRPLWLISGLVGLVSSVGLSELIKADIRAQERLLKEYRQAAMTDGLTGLANRQALENALKNALHEFSPQRNPLSLIMIDIDNFKAFNDQWGHQAGDAALKTVSNAAVEYFSGKGCVARYGGEEFAIAMPSMSLRESIKLAEGFREYVSRIGCKINDKSSSVTISVGVAEAKDREAPDELVLRADQALYAAKRNGRNCIHVSENSETQSAILEQTLTELSLS